MRDSRSIRLTGLCAAVALAAAACASGDPASGGSPEPDAGVSTGYGTEEEKAVTGSVSSVSAEDMRNTSHWRVEDLLQGRVPGLTVWRTATGGYTLRIRGASSFMGNTDPLIVIDGTPIEAAGLEGALAGLSPNDIERIDVLKDASSTAIYGLRGANGVIVIRTKRGQ